MSQLGHCWILLLQMLPYVSKMKTKGSSHHKCQRRKEKQPVIRVRCALYRVLRSQSPGSLLIISFQLHASVCAEAFTTDNNLVSPLGSLLSSKCLGEQHALPFRPWAGMSAPAMLPQVAQLKPAHQSCPFGTCLHHSRNTIMLAL